MRVVFENEKHSHLLFIDSEWDGEQLIQFSGLLFNNLGNSIYELGGSFNLYIKNETVSKFFSAFTGITNQFLKEYGISYEDVKHFWKDFTYNLDNLMIIGHEIAADKKILWKNGINIDNFDFYCTYHSAKRLYPELKKYSVKSLAELSSWFITSEHDSYCDVWALVPIFSDLKEKENANRNN